MYPYFEIFGRTIGSYAAMSYLGLIAAILVAWRLTKDTGLKFEDILLLAVSLALGLLVGGVAMYALTRYRQIIECTALIFGHIRAGTLELSHITQAIRLCFGGMVFYGGMIGAAIALFIHMKVAKLSCRAQLWDVFAVCVPLFHGFGRIGCFLGGCCYGKVSDFGFIAHNELLPEMSGVRRFPVALLESAFCFLIFALLLYCNRKKIARGKCVYLYLTIYPIGRFLIEFLRGDEIRGFLFGLSTSQWISLILLAFALYKWVTIYRRERAAQ